MICSFIDSLQPYSAAMTVLNYCGSLNCFESLQLSLYSALILKIYIFLNWPTNVNCFEISRAKEKSLHEVALVSEEEVNFSIP